MNQTRWFNNDKHLWLIYCEGKVIMYNTKINTRELASISSINIMILLNVELLPWRLEKHLSTINRKKIAPLPQAPQSHITSDDALNSPGETLEKVRQNYGKEEMSWRIIYAFVACLLHFCIFSRRGMINGLVRDAKEMSLKGLRWWRSSVISHTHTCFRKTIVYVF